MCSIILLSIIKIFQTVAELRSGNELLTPARQNSGRDKDGINDFL